MIKNETQYQMMKYWLKRFEEDAQKLEAQPLPEGADPTSRQALIDEARSEVEILSEQIAKYEEKRDAKTQP